MTSIKRTVIGLTVLLSVVCFIYFGRSSHVKSLFCESSSLSLDKDSERESLFPISVDNLWGFIDTGGSVVIKPEFKAVGRFSEGLAAFKSVYDGRWGYIDLEGEVVIAPTLDAAGSFFESRAVVTINGFQGAIDKNGKFIVEPFYERVQSFSEGRAFVMRGKRWRMIDREGRYVTQDTFVQANTFRENLASFTGLNNDYGLSGYLNRVGEVEILLEDDTFVNIEGLGFSYGRASVSRRRPTTLLDYVRFLEWGELAYGLIDHSGEIVVPIAYEFVGVSSECMATVSQGDRYGAIDLEGNQLIPIKYSYIGRFSEGLAIAQRRTGDKYGYIDRQGKFVIRPIQTITGRPFLPAIERTFHRGRAVFQEDNGKFGYIDATGDVVIKPVFETVSPFREELAKFEDTKGWGYIDASGKIIWHSVWTSVQ